MLKSYLFAGRGRRLLLSLIAIAASASLSVAAQGMGPSVTVKDQAIVDSRVVILKVVSATPGWIVIHSDVAGKPGPVLGYAALRSGENDNVVVAIDAKKATPTLYAMLHVDAGAVGVYEFPGPDVPTMDKGMMVSPGFKVTR